MTNAERAQKIVDTYAWQVTISQRGDLINAITTAFDEVEKRGCLETGFCDGNNRDVKSRDEVEYRFGQRRGIMIEAFPDGDALVLFKDTNTVETVKWHHLCKVPKESLNTE